jgi:hypothetical protein
MIMKSVATLAFVGVLIAKAEQQIAQISDGAKKVESTKELTMAKDAMAANDLEKCKSHLGNAIKGMDAM